MAAVLMRGELPAAAAAAVVLSIAVGMVSRRRLPELKGVGPVTAMLLVGMVNYLVFVAWPNWYTVGWWTLWNVLTVLVARIEDRRVGLEPSVEP